MEAVAPYGQSAGGAQFGSGRPTTETETWETLCANQTTARTLSTTVKGTHQCALETTIHLIRTNRSRTKPRHASEPISQSQSRTIRRTTRDGRLPRDSRAARSTRDALNDLGISGEKEGGWAEEDVLWEMSRQGGRRNSVDGAMLFVFRYCGSIAG